MLRRTFAAALPLALFAPSARAQAPKKLVVYTSNDSTLNDLVFGAFKAETGIEVEPVAAGSGVVMRRLQAEKARPLGDIVWGVSRSLLQTNKALFEPYVSKNHRRHAGGIPRPRQSVDRQQPPSAGDPAEHQDRARRRRAEELGRPARSQMEGQDRLHRSGQLRLGLYHRDHAGRFVGRRRGGLEEGRPAVQEHEGAEPFVAGLPGRRQRRVSARHLARICRADVGPGRGAGEGDLSERRHVRGDGRRRHHQGRTQHRERQGLSSTTSTARTSAR